jgi:hypothetical protein
MPTSKEDDMRKTSMALVFAFVFVAHQGMAADDGQTQPKVNVNSTNSFITPVDVIATTNGSGNVKGVSCALLSGSIARVKFTVDGGAVQTVDLHSYQTPYNDAGTLTRYTGWVPFNVRFSSSIRVQIQKAGGGGSGIDCAVSWGLD